MSFHDFLGDSQTQPGAAFLGREKGMEDTLQVFGLDAASPVYHLKNSRSLFSKRPD